jgi:hypothetical protein
MHPILERPVAQVGVADTWLTLDDAVDTFSNPGNRISAKVTYLRGLTMKTRFRSLTATISLLFVFALLTTGCGGALVGTWKAEPEPKDMAAYINSATFKSDNTYTAVEKKGEAVEKFSGTYEFNGASLKLKSPGKPERNYKATYMMMGPKLDLTIGDKKQTLKKQ